MSADHSQALEDTETATAVDHRRLIAHDTQHGPQHSEAAKALALSVYAETGSCETASKETGIPRTTIDSWVKRDPDIDSKLDALRRAIRENVAHKYAQIAIKATAELIDRLENGDEHVDKEGNITRRKVPARELAFIASVATDKHALLTGTMGKANKRDATLEALAQKLEASIDAKVKKATARDADPA